MTRVLVILVALAACGDHDHPKALTERHNRVVDPPANAVSALPPYAIRADGVGPFKLDASLSDLNDLLRTGPHLAQIEIPKVIRVSVLRAEDDAVLIGGEPQGKASFVAVVGAQVARTESGIQVGSTRQELVAELGDPVVDLDRARDPRVVVPASMPELHAVLDGDRIVGLVVQPRRDAVQPAAPDPCPRPVVAPSDPARVRFGACFGGLGAIVAVDGDELGIYGADDRLLATTPLRATTVFAAPVRAPDGRDEIYVIARSDELGERTWSITGYRLDGGKLVRVVEPTPIYQLTEANARWIGSELRDLDLVLEVASRADGVEVGGLLTTRSGARLRDLLVLDAVQVPRVHKKPLPNDTKDQTAHDDHDDAPTAPPDAGS